jgi:hypothetical protein
LTEATEEKLTGVLKKIVAKYEVNVAANAPMAAQEAAGNQTQSST